MPTASLYMLRRIYRLSAGAGFPIDGRGIQVQQASGVILRIGGRRILQAGLGAGSNFVWSATPAAEILVGELETIDIDVDQDMMEIEVGLTCRDTIAKNLAMDRTELHRFADGKHTVTINNMQVEPFEIDDDGCRVKKHEFEWEEVDLD